ncbi:MAG: protein-disulfide reductase DsbD domain-containing protein [Moraxellaceae bacterium]
MSAVQSKNFTLEDQALKDRAFKNAVLLFLTAWWLLLLAIYPNQVAAAPPTESATIGNSVSNTVSSLLGNFRNSPNQKFLPVERAFTVSNRQQADELLIDIRVTPEHYVYQDQFRFTSVAGLTVGTPTFSRAPTFEEDPAFGRVAVFDQDVQLRVPVAYTGVGTGTVAGELKFRWQGCAKAGLCYPPQIETIQIQATEPAAPTKSTVQSAVSVTSPDGQLATKTPDPANITAITDAKPPAAGIVSASAQRNVREQGELRPLSMPIPRVTISDLSVQSEQGNLPLQFAGQGNGNSVAVSAAAPAAVALDTDPFGLGQRPWLAIALLFLAGLGLAFTPCVLPMIPIVANLVARQHRRSAKHGLALSAAYVFGVASSYAMLGALIAAFGHQINLVAWLQQPAILIGFALIFVLLALHTFNLLPIRLPHAVRVRIERLGQIGQHERWAGSLFGSAVVGFFSALVVSPCVSAPLAGVLLSVSTVGDPLLGAVALFALGCGLGVPLMVLGATEGRLLPKAGNWLNWVRQGFGLLLLGVALYLLNRVFSTSLILAAWSALFMLLAVWMWSWQGRGQLLSRAVALMLGVWSGVQLMGVAQGQHDPWQPLAKTTSSVALSAPATTTAVQTITSVAELQQLQVSTPRLLVDVTADWCISCKIMERELFGVNAPAALTTWTRVKLDVTEPSVEAKQVLAQLHLFGPPALLFYQDGVLQARLVGETDLPTLQRQLDQLATP